MHKKGVKLLIFTIPKYSYILNSFVMQQSVSDVLGGSQVQLKLPFLTALLCWHVVISGAH